jgi:hypothetical protein
MSRPSVTGVMMRRRGILSPPPEPPPDDLYLAAVHPDYPTWVPYMDFEESMVDATASDMHGMTARDYYAQAVGTLYESELEGTGTAGFNRNDYRNVNRWSWQELLLLYRLTGDIRIVDRMIQLIQIWTSNRVLRSDGWFDWNGPYSQDVYAIDAQLVMGMLAPWWYLAKVCHDNGIVSPAGVNYQAFWQDELNWFDNEFKPRWEAVRGTSGSIENNQRPFIDRPQRHCQIWEALANHFIGLIKNDQNYLDAAQWQFNDRLEADSTCNQGIDGRTVQLWSHAAPNAPQPSSRSLQYTVYLNLEINALVLVSWMGIFTNINASYLRRIANAFAAFVCDRTPLDNEPLAQGIGGDVSSRCGREFDLNYRGRTVLNQIANRALYQLCGWDDSGVMEDYLLPAIPYGTDARSARFRSSAGRVYQRYQQGWHSEVS